MTLDLELELGVPRPQLKTKTVTPPKSWTSPYKVVTNTRRSFDAIPPDATRSSAPAPPGTWVFVHVGGGDGDEWC